MNNWKILYLKGGKNNSPQEENHRFEVQVKILNILKIS
jgi:hypothetical protein